MREEVHQPTSCPLWWWLAGTGAACPLRLGVTVQDFASGGDAGEMWLHQHLHMTPILHLLKEDTGFVGSDMGTVPAPTFPRVQQETDSMLSIPLSVMLCKITGIKHHKVSKSSLWPSHVTESCCAYTVVKGCMIGAAGPPAAQLPCLLPSCQAFSVPR